MRHADPWWTNFRPERHDQHHAKRSNPVNDAAERFQSSWISPMRIFEDHQHRLLASQRLEAAFNGTRPQRRPGGHRPGDTLEVPTPEVLKLEQSAEKPSRALGDDNHVWLGDPLQTRREVRRFAHNAALLRFARSDQIAYND